MRLRLRSRTRTNAAGEPLRFRNLTAAGPSAKERESLAERGEAMKDGSFPIRNVEDLRNAVQSVGRAKDYEAAKRWIMKRARELDAEDELPDDWTTTAAGVPGPVLYAQMSETQAQDNARYAEELCPGCSTLLGEGDAVCASCGHRRETITAAFDESKVVRHPKGTKVAGRVGGGRFAVKENAAGRHEVVDQDSGKKVAETTERDDAQKVADEKNDQDAIDAPLSGPELEEMQRRNDLAGRDKAASPYFGGPGETTTVVENAIEEPSEAESRARLEEQARNLGIDVGQPTEELSTEIIERVSEPGFEPGVDDAPEPSPIEGPFKYPSGWEGRYDPVEGRYIGMDDIYMPADFDPTRDAGSAMVQPTSARDGMLAQADVLDSEATTLRSIADSAEGSVVAEQIRERAGELERGAENLRSIASETTTVENALTTIRQPGSTPPDRMLRIAGYANRGDGRSYGGGLADYSSADIIETLSSNALTPTGAARLVRELEARGDAPPGMSSTVTASAPCDECDELDALVAAIPVKPPADWFELPKLERPTPMTVTDDGRIFGHAAVWGTCHLGNPRGAGVCVQPPRSQSDYGLFHLGEVETASGARVPVGQITLNTGHAPLGASARNAAAHYDHTGTCAADVVVGEDEHGIVFAGALRPDMTPERARTLMGSKISGDWRGGELVGLLAVNVPGFPVPRARLVASAEGVDEVMALVAAGVVVDAERSPFAGLRPEAVVEILAARAEGIDALVELAGA